MSPDPLSPPITASRANVYTGSLIDRAAHRRVDADWIDAARRDPGARFAPVWRGRHLVADASRAVLLTPAEGLRVDDHPWAFLGLLDASPVFAVDMGGVEDPFVALGGQRAGWAFVELRPVVALLPPADAALLAHARGLMHWRARHRFCGFCGGPVTPGHAGNVLHCPACGAQHFPRTDAAVIMLVTRGDLALLAHSQRFPIPTMFSTLAGFVEPGESLEEAVAREVFEEAGIRVGRVAYHSSQPWPFPASLMVGFYAETTESTIVLDDDELTEARWFTRAEIADAPAHGFAIPGPDSIARRLIEDWLSHDGAAS